MNNYCFLNATLLKVLTLYNIQSKSMHMYMLYYIFWGIGRMPQLIYLIQVDLNKTSGVTDTRHYVAWNRFFTATV
jgi:hypothetical protein